VNATIDSLREIYTAIQRHDAERLSQALAHDIEWILPETVPWGGTHHGHLGVTALVEIFEEHVDGIWADPDELIDAGDRVVVLGRVSGTARSTGEEFEVPFAHVWALTDGVPSRFRGYYDTAPITTALGLS
jgi:ketosteroid isomerase-like protein